MNNLSRLQHAFQARVLKPDANDTPNWVSADGRADPAVQIGVYSFAYRARLLEVLGKDFPAVNLAMGDEHFFELANDYIQSHPSKYFSLRDFGQHFAKFIAQQPIHEEHPWLTELATFEWTLCSAFDAADTPRVSEQDIAGIAPEQWPHLRFEVHPSLHCLTMNWNTPEIWKTLKSDKPQDLQVTEMSNAYWMIWRQDLVTRFRSLAQDEQAALICLCAGDSFNDICVALSEFHDSDEVPLHAATYLKSWLNQGLLSKILQ